ncbi:hypothetical protein FRB96_009358 [Tulasnella sp. 330]|nr:hypothetical protein FRB96_009358 [Tulasnella sp. 330]KAG8885270.1 hypothetical protein FRB97_001716 [Tulasnella sp. 331]
MGVAQSTSGQSSSEPQKTLFYGAQWLMLEERMDKEEASDRIMERYLKARPAPPGWDLHPHPIWNEAPYFFHPVHRIVASHYLLSDPFKTTKQRASAVASLLRLFYDVTAEVGPAPRYGEIAFSLSQPSERTGGTPSLHHRDSGIHIPRRRNVPVTVLFIDHQRRFASSIPNDLIHDDAQAKALRLRKWTYSDDSMLHEVVSMRRKDQVLRARYWSYITKYPHYYLNRKQDVEEASKEACFAIATLQVDRKQRRKSYSSYGSSSESESSSEPLFQDACQAVLDDLKFYREGLEHSIGLDYGRRIVRVAGFLADYYAQLVDDRPEE